MPILEQSRSDKLITSSIENGWTFYAAVTPPTKQQAKRDRYVFSQDVGKAVRVGPVVLVLGSEGEGLRPFLKKHVQYCVSLDKGPGTDALVDSLNVSLTLPPFQGLRPIDIASRSVLPLHYCVPAS